MPQFIPHLLRLSVYLFELIQEILRDFRRADEQDLLIVKAVGGTGKVIRTGGDERAVDDNDLLVHQRIGRPIHEDRHALPFQERRLAAFIPERFFAFENNGYVNPVFPAADERFPDRVFRKRIGEDSDLFPRRLDNGRDRLADIVFRRKTDEETRSVFELDNPWLVAFRTFRAEEVIEEHLVKFGAENCVRLFRSQENHEVIIVKK